MDLLVDPLLRSARIRRRGGQSGGLLLCLIHPQLCLLETLPQGLELLGRFLPLFLHGSYVGTSLFLHGSLESPCSPLSESSLGIRGKAGGSVLLLLCRLVLTGAGSGGSPAGFSVPQRSSRLIIVRHPEAEGQAFRTENVSTKRPLGLLKLGSAPESARRCCDRGKQGEDGQELVQLR